jgi:hypothetical protein
MSLHTLAKHVQQKGRGKDQMLVHMTPREVQGLQALAKANGGSLTINPETGLAEAGFLEEILPMVAMAAATYFTAGAAAPALSAALGSTMAGGAAAGALAGAGVGAIGAAAQDKDVGKGALFGGIGGAISGGMGAYDGALSADLFSSAGATPAVTPTVSPDVVNKVALDTSFTGQIPGASGAPIDVNSGLAGYPSVPPGTMPPGLNAPTPVSPTQAGIDASRLTGQARIDALTKLDPSANAFGNAPASGAEQSLYSAENLARPTEVGDIYRPRVPTPSDEDKAKVDVAKSYYSTMGLPGKTMTQALPALAANIGMNEQSGVMPEEDPYKSASTLSPNFQGYTPRQPKPYYQAQYTRYAAGGGLMDAYQAGGPVERMSQMNTALNPQGGLYPQGMVDKTQYAVPTQRPTSMEVLDAGAQRTFNNGGSAKEKKQRANLTADRTMAAMSADQAGIAMLNNARYGANMTGVAPLRSSRTLGDLPNVVGAARGGLADLGGYSDGGRMLKGPGDGMSDSIPGIIGRKQPARLADGEFVVPADVVSHLGNGSTDAGARRLYAMMDRARQARTGKKKQAPAVNADKILSRVA